PNEGDSEVILRQVEGEKELRFAAGEARGMTLPPGAGPALPADLVVSEDGQWVAFTVYPTRKESKAAEKTRKPLTNKVPLVNLTTGARIEFENIRRFSFSGVMGGWLALHKNAANSQSTPSTPAGPTPPAQSPSTSPVTPRPEAEKWAGSDLLLHELATG